MSTGADISYPKTTITNIAFGSCHRNKAVDKPNHQIIWPSITKLQPQTFLWLGDAIYSPSKKHSVAPIGILEDEYNGLVSNATIGYIDFLRGASSSSSLTSLTSVHGIYDDHDFGGNDYGKQMPNKSERKDIFLDFIQSSNDVVHMALHNTQDAHKNQVFGDDESSNKNGISNQKQDMDRMQKIKSRDGVYSSIEFGTNPQKVKIILLDTRSGRDKHCPIPSIGAMNLPLRLGSPLACLTRWITAGLNLQRTLKSCHDVKMLSDDQWEWLEHQLIGDSSKTGSDGNDDDDDENEQPSVYIIGSSIQVLTTNPAIESWGHYPNERLRLLNLLNRVKRGSAVVILSGDVHHGEILDSSQSLKYNKDQLTNNADGRIIEVTSSGLTHSCVDPPFYGHLCGPILEHFSEHRYESKKNYYTGRNFGSIQIKWGDHEEWKQEYVTSKMQIDVHDVNGEQVLSTGLHPLSYYGSQMTDDQLRSIDGPSDGHLLPYLKKCTIVIFIVLVTMRMIRRTLGNTENQKEKKN